MTQPRLYLVGNAHLDPVWLWRWPEGCAEAIGTCWAAVELLAEHPGMIFTRGEAVVYRWIEEMDPELFGRIQELVHAQRWVIVNGWWLQPDCNLPSGEAFIRQALYGKSYFRDRFGVDVTVGYNVDSFGHAATLPMLLRHTGFTSYVFMRPMEHEHALPSSLFDWVAPDGSSVTTFRLSVSYNTSDSWPIDRKVEQVQALAATQGIPLMCFYGVGNHGGGPTRRHLAEIAQLQAEGKDIVLSDPNRYFAEVAALPRPTVSGELQMHAIGCYSAVSAVKALNRKAEAMLAQAEAASTLALLQAGAAYPHARLRLLWETLLFNQFHDILCGSSVASATRDAEQEFGSVIQGAEHRAQYGCSTTGADRCPSTRSCRCHVPGVQSDRGRAGAGGGIRALDRMGANRLPASGRHRRRGGVPGYTAGEQHLSQSPPDPVRAGNPGFRLSTVPLCRRHSRGETGIDPAGGTVPAGKLPVASGHRSANGEHRLVDR